MSCEDWTLDIRRGESATFRVTVTDEDSGDLFDLTGATVHFRVKLLAGDDADPAVIAKSSAIPAEVTILPQAGDTLGQADVFLVPDDTKNIALARYVFEVRVVEVGGDEKPAAFGALVVRGEAVKLP